MKIVKCINGHFYDKDKQDECPLCQKQPMKPIPYPNYKLCSKCSTQNPINYNYCYNCGNSLISRDMEDREINAYICVIHHRSQKGNTLLLYKNDRAFIAYCGKIFLNSLDCYDEDNHISIKVNEDASSLLIRYNDELKELNYEFNKLVKYKVKLPDSNESWDIIISKSEIDFRDYLKGYTVIRGNLYVLNEPITQNMTAVLRRLKE